MSGRSTGVTLSLEGLEADNMLAFLALLGLLRVLEAERPASQPRACWHGVPPKASLVLLAEIGRGDPVATAHALSAVAAGGMGKVAASYGVLRQNDLKFTFDEFRKLSTDANNDRERSRLIAALASDGALKRGSKDQEVEPTPLCAMFGQGHQHFLQRLVRAVTADAGTVDRIYRALFEPWRYRDDGEWSFRWDPAEDRRHAYQFGDPSDTRYKVGTVAGADQLAGAGFALMTSVPTAAGLGTLGVSGPRVERDVVWPLVSVPTSLRGHLALLAHPGTYDPSGCEALRGLGVLAVARARRYWVGKYLNFERARIQYLGRSANVGSDARSAR